MFLYLKVQKNKFYSRLQTNQTQVFPAEQNLYYMHQVIYFTKYTHKEAN